jgi:glutamine synthetase
VLRIPGPDACSCSSSGPGTLDESLKALEEDHEFLLKGDVFSTTVIDRWISYKREKEITPLRLRPHPMEFSMYYDI